MYLARKKRTGDIYAMKVMKKAEMVREISFGTFLLVDAQKHGESRDDRKRYISIHSESICSGPLLRF